MAAQPLQRRALRPGQMAITVIVSWAELFGHSYVAFEWFADEVPGPRTSRRRHEVYHLRADPTEAERARGVINPGCPKLLSWLTRPASVVVERRPRILPAEGRSWTRVDRLLSRLASPVRRRFGAWGVAAVAATSPPCYNFLELGGGEELRLLGRGSGGGGGDRC